MLKYGNLMLPGGHILDLYRIRLSNAAPFCENYTKLYFNAKQLKKGLNREGGGGGGENKNFGALFSKNVPFMVLILI